MSVKYFLGSLADAEDISQQAKIIRNLVFSGRRDSEILDCILELLQNEPDIKPDTAKIINIALLCNYGAEDRGIGGGDFLLKLRFYQKLIEIFPNEVSFGFKLAEVALLCGEAVDYIFKVLKSAMIADTNRKFYPSAEMFDLLHQSGFSFEFDMLLLENYYQPCDEQAFNGYISDFLIEYQQPEQQKIISEVKWKGL